MKYWIYAGYGVYKTQLEYLEEQEEETRRTI